MFQQTDFIVTPMHISNYLKKNNNNKEAILKNRTLVNHSNLKKKKNIDMLVFTFNLVQEYTSRFTPQTWCLFFSVGAAKQVNAVKSVVIMTTLSQTVNTPHISPRYLCGPNSVNFPFTTPNLLPHWQNDTKEPKWEILFEKSFGKKYFFKLLLEVKRVREKLIGNRHKKGISKKI